MNSKSVKKLSLAIAFCLHQLMVFAQAAYTQPDVDIQHYAFELTLTDADNHIEGIATIKLLLKKESIKTIWLDLIGKNNETAQTGMKVRAVTLQGKPLTFNHIANRINITLPDNLGISAQTLSIAYEGTPTDGLIISKNKYGDRTFFGDNWPNRAHHWLPVIDHPSDKATCEFKVIAPSHYKVIANGKLIEESDLMNGNRLTYWQENTPIPTKVMVIGAAKFAVETVGEVGCVPIQSWLYPQDREKGFYDYRPAKAILDYFVTAIGPYSYEKLANVQSKTTFGGMENASCIFYSENIIHGVKNLQMESLLAHEIAHQYFGNSASEKEWQHVWLSESFATYFSALYLEHTYGKDTLDMVMNTNKGTVFRYAKMSPNGTIVDSVTSVSLKILNPNSYEKGGWVLHMLRNEVGNELFWKGIKAYYQKYQNGNATTADFQQVMEQTSGKSLAAFFKQWLYQPGYPEVEWSWVYEAASKKLIIKANQVQNVGKFSIPLVFSCKGQNGTELLKTEKLVMDKSAKEFTVKLNTAPTEVSIDPDNWILMKATLKKN